MKAGGGILVLLPSLAALGGGIERAGQEWLGSLARVRPGERLAAVLARERWDELRGAHLPVELKVVGVQNNSRAGRLLEFAARAMREALAQRPRVVLCLHLHHAPLGLLLARAVAARLVVVAHGVEAWELRSASVRSALQAADAVVAVSAYTREALLRSAGLPGDRVRVIHNALDTERFVPGEAHPQVAAMLEELRRPRLLSVARLEAHEGYKGVDVVLRTLAGPARRLEASYVVVGDGSDRPRLEALARELGVAARFLGWAKEEDLVDLYRACDLFVLPSRGEGFGYVFVEALACGLPVVGGHSDGTVDALGGGALGLLVDPLDPASVAEGVAAQLEGRSEPSMRDPSALHAAVEERFGRAAFDQRLARLLDDLVQP